MEVKASVKHLRMSAQKVRLVLDVVRTLPAQTALDQLKFINKAATLPVEKLLKSAIANAENTYGLEKSNLMISEIRADEGVTLKRWMPRAFGRATSIRKRACHITLVLKEIKDSGTKAKKEVKLEDPVKLEQLVKDNEKKDKTKPSKAKDAKPGRDSSKNSELSEQPKMFRRKAG
jgi:large subunit ribosomal protein L22